MDLKVFDDRGALRIEVRGRALAFTRLITLVWATAWLALEVALLLEWFRSGWSPTVIVTMAWTLGGPFVLLALVWAAAGKPEVVTVTGPTFHVWRGVGPFGRTLRFDSHAIRALRVFDARHPVVTDYDAVQAFWDRGRGRLAFDVDDRTYGFGSSLDDCDVARVSCAIAARLPTSEAQSADAVPDVADSPRRRFGWAGYVTRTVLGAGLLIPAASLITDLPICTGGALGGGYDPISSARLRGQGQVVLVPFSDFPEATAQQIAQHFQTKYALTIRAGTALPLPDHAIDRDRDQVDSDALMSMLERAYPDTDSVVIGLTTADMFIRDVDWSYAFSNRREPRLAVVSPFRMDRGCFGITLANDDTRMARLRKMVGKNIGVLFYKLPLSNHPRSMMYAQIGGPQELDTIREEF